MAAKDTASDNSFLLGEIAATTRGTSDDVKAIRLDLGDVARRVGGVEARVEAIEAEREVLVPQYSEWKHRISNEVQVLTAWKHEQKGALFGGMTVGKVAIAIISALAGAGLFFGVETVSKPDASAKSEVSVERSIQIKQ